MIDKINQKIDDLVADIDDLQKDLTRISTTIKEKNEFRNFLMVLIRENKEKDSK